MSDFIYSGAGTPHSDLKHELDRIYGNESPGVLEFQGSWGSMAVTKNNYYGFDPIETPTHLAVVVGGPLLLFRDNRFLTGSDPGAPPSRTAGTKAILERWKRGLLNWQNNISGPFVALFINKESKEVSIVTDLLSFIPVYKSKVQDAHYFSTHVDALARITRMDEDPDLCSQVDFALHGIITYPYTSYRNVWQLAPGSIHTLTAPSGQLSSRTYWVPREVELYRDFKEPVAEFQKSLDQYIGSLTLGMDKVGMFLTGGETSRVVASALSPELTRDAYLIQDTSKGEEEVARKTAKSLGCSFRMVRRQTGDYIQIMPEVADLIGSGAGFFDVPAYGPHKEYDLGRYPAVFGGLYANTLFKGAKIKKTQKSQKYQFVAQQKDLKHSPVTGLKNELFDAGILEGVERRRDEHFERVRRFRNKSAAEWFEIWPASMNTENAQWLGNRRLFRSYEPFMSHEMVQLSSVLPQEWKLNREFFQKAIRPYLKPLKWLPDSEGLMPYFGRGANRYYGFKKYLKTSLTRNKKAIGKVRPWVDVSLLVNSEGIKDRFREYRQGLEQLSPAFKGGSVDEFLNSSEVGAIQKLDILQLLYYGSNNQSRRPELVYVRKLG